MNSPSLFVSTAIPFVNAPPHLGFALEVVLADALARHARARGVDVRFVSGTDDNSLKNVRAAEALGVSTRELVDTNGARYRALDGVVGASFDDFVRTSADARHRAAVRALWTACARRGDLEKRTYRGLYCVGCEQYFHPSELDEGLCPEHRTQPETVEEENWFFRLSRYERQISAALESGRLKIEPPARAREIERFVAGGLRDVSVSRSRLRARGWGLEVPGDPDQIVKSAPQPGFTSTASLEIEPLSSVGPAIVVAYSHVVNAPDSATPSASLFLFRILMGVGPEKAFATAASANCKSGS